MMSQDLGGVVDPTLKVYGTSNVRVVDASILPFQVDGHLTSTLYAVAERASEMIRDSSKTFDASERCDVDTEWQLWYDTPTGKRGF